MKDLKTLRAEMEAWAAGIRRREEARKLRDHEHQWNLHRKYQTPLTPELAGARLRHMIETDVSLPVDPAVEKYRQHADRMCRTQLKDITVKWTAHYPNGYAWPRLRELECAPIRTAEGYASFLHEAGHILNPCPGTPVHTRAVNRDGTGTLCCACELTAWVYAIDSAIEWTATMHRHLSECLSTYRQYAAGDTLAELDMMTGEAGYRLARLRRAKREVGL